MPTFTINSDIVSNGGYVFSIAASDSTYILLPGVSITSVAAVFFEGSGVTGTNLQLSGTISTTAAFVAVLAGANAVVSLESTALVVSTWSDPFGAYPAFSITGATSSFANAGTIQTSVGIGVCLAGPGSTGTNSGLIEAGTGGADLGTDVVFTNLGAITAGMTGTDSFGIRIGGIGTEVVNDGTIDADGSTNATGIAVGAAGSTITNSGSIGSTTGWGIRNTSADAAVTLTVVNSGTISGVTGSILGGAGADSITNSGDLVGNVRLGGGNDVFDGIGGTLTGQVNGGTGADTYRVSTAGIVIVETGSDIDRVESTVDFSLNGRAGLENLLLLNGAVVGNGNALKNVITGNGANNTLSGLGDNDRLGGNGGNDTLRGDFGRDTLSGGGGDDVLVGGRGGDSLSGGTGSDVFKFNSTIDSGLTSTTRDVINDFTAGQDIIDLFSIDARAGVSGNQAFTFIGGAAFSANGQLRLDTSGPQAILEGDVNNDRVADFQITLNGVTVLGASDFIL